MAEWSDSTLLRLYSLWSEEKWAAGFLKPTDDIVRDFVGWLSREWEAEEGYETEMLTKARVLLKAAQPASSPPDGEPVT